LQSSTTLQHLLAETIKQDLLSDYACRRCSLSATYEKLLAQRDRLSATPDLAPPPAPLSPSGKFDLPPTPNAVSTTMTASRKARFKKTAKLVDKVKSLIAAGDFENELIEEKDGVKVERVRGIASKVIRFARVRSARPCGKKSRLTIV
jgi:ubiquitin carboxyl-terminal hydrolase 1